MRVEIPKSPHAKQYKKKLPGSLKYRYNLGDIAYEFLA